MEKNGAENSSTSRRSNVMMFQRRNIETSRRCNVVTSGKTLQTLYHEGAIKGMGESN